MEATIRTILTSPEERAGLNNVINCRGRDILLNNDQIHSVLQNSPIFKAQMTALGENCKRGTSEWDSMTTIITDTILGPWQRAIGQANITITTSCRCRVLMWEASINDRYDFNPMWTSSSRTPEAEMHTRLVRAAQLFSLCGWREFFYRGCAHGSAY